jgi:hypothetical protein
MVVFQLMKKNRPFSNKFLNNEKDTDEISGRKVPVITTLQYCSQEKVHRTVL